jgi:uracil-DNA glycosylase family 4
MAFFHVDKKAFAKKHTKSIKNVSFDTLKNLQCKVCPLAKEWPNLNNPDMKPHGSKHPKIYVLGESPTKADDLDGRPFVMGSAAQLLRSFIPDDWIDDIRWNNVVRTRPPNRDPTIVEITCCRTSVEEDIARSKPVAIFGMGSIPLHWAINQKGINLWRGRKIPVNVAGHSCWFYPMLDPSYIVHERKFEPSSADEYGSAVEFAFSLDLQRALFEIGEGLPDPHIVSQADAQKHIHVILNADDAVDVIQRMYEEKYVGMDYETNCLRPFHYNAKILSVGLAASSAAYAFPIDHSQCHWSEREKQRVRKAFKRFLFRAKSRKISHHLPFELEWSAEEFGKECMWAGVWEDTESQAYMLDERRGALSLDFLCLQHFGFNLKDISGNLDRAKLDHIDIRTVLKYNGLDAKWHLNLFKKQKPLVTADGLDPVYEEQMRRIPTLVAAQLRGVPVSQKQVKTLLEEYSSKLKKYAGEIQEQPEARKFKKLKKYAYRPSSPQDTSYLCKTILGVDVKTVDEPTLSKLGNKTATLTVKWRQQNKMISTYIKPCLKGSDSSVVFSDGMLHPVFSTTSVATWRTSSESPNAQNWPKHDDYGKKIRKMVKAPIGYKIVSFDYAGCQARNVAMESLDHNLIDAYWTGYDIHADWRERLLRAYPKWAPKEDRKDPKKLKALRQRAKNEFVFPTFFGAQSYSTSMSLGIPETIMEDLRMEFFEVFPEIDRWHQQLFKFYKDTGYITGLSRFRRRAPISENQLINSPIQSDESIIVIDGMSRITEIGDERIQPILEVHDDITFCVPNEFVDELAQTVFDTLLYCPFDWARVVPIGVEMSVGQDWGSMEEVAAHSSDKWTFRNGFKHTRETSSCDPSLILKYQSEDEEYYRG